MRAAREGTKDGLEKTKAAVKKGRSFIRTKSFISQGMCLLFYSVNVVSSSYFWERLWIVQ